MNNAERASEAGKITRERFLEDVRPILDEALEKRVGVNSVELSLATGELEGSEDLKVYFYEDGAPSYSLIELNSQYLSVDTFDSKNGDWDRVCVYEGWLEDDDTPRFLISGTGLPKRVPNEADWRMALEKTKGAFESAISGQFKESQSKKDGEVEEREGEGQYFIEEYDKIFHELSKGALRYPSTLYPGFEYEVVAASDESDSRFEMQNFRHIGGENGSKRPARRLLIVNDLKNDIVNTAIAIYESPTEIKWFKHKQEQSGAPLSSDEKAWAISATKEIVLASKQA